MELNRLLNVKEAHLNYILEKTKFYQVVSLKANIPGPNKKIKEAYILTDYFHHQILNQYNVEYEFFDEEDGPLYLYFFDKSITNLKLAMEKIEESKAGRLVDIDVYTNDQKSQSRSELRKCYLCDQPAFVCGKKKTHSLNELLTYVQNETWDLVQKVTFDKVGLAMKEELDLDPKFGLVSLHTNGSHKDMNYEIMASSIPAVCESMIKILKVSYDNNNSFTDQFNLIRKLGKEAEIKMLETTKGINTYKGLIFALGLIMWGFGKSLTLKMDPFLAISLVTKDLEQELKMVTVPKTYGEIAYQKFHILGSRGVAISNFKEVKTILFKHQLDNYEDKIVALCELISVVDDTILLKRCDSDINKYQNVKKMFQKVIKYDYKQIKSLNEYALANNLSFGGSADLLIICLWIKKIQKYFSFIYSGDKHEKTNS